MSMGMPKEDFLQGMYLVAKDYGFEFLDECPDITFVALESEIYNCLMEHDDYKRYYRAADVRARRAAERVWHVTQSRRQP